MNITSAKIKTFAHKWASNIFWLLFRYNNFKKYCSFELSIEVLNPYRWYRWHDGARCFRARSTLSGQPVFIKTEGTFHLLENEYRMTSLFSQNLPKGCPAIELSDFNGPIKLLVYEYVNGRTLADYLKRPGSRVHWPLFFDQVLKILDNLFRHKMIHRDITPSNLLIQSDNKNNLLRIVLIDFAFAVIEGEPNIDSRLEKSKVTHLGQDLNPRPFVWDDAYAALQILRKIEEYSGHLFSDWCDRIEKRVGRITHTMR